MNKKVTYINNMEDKDYSKIVGYSQIGGALGIIYGVYTKSGFLKGVGFYLLGSFVAGLISSGITSVKK